MEDATVADRLLKNLEKTLEESRRLRGELHAPGAAPPASTTASLSSPESKSAAVAG